MNERIKAARDRYTIERGVNGGWVYSWIRSDGYGDSSREYPSLESAVEAANEAAYEAVMMSDE